MRLRGLNGKEYNITVKTVIKNDCSWYHLQTREILKELYGVIPIIEEFYIPGGDNKLYLDFFLPTLKIAIECQGQQHYTYIKFFHKNVNKFNESQLRDQDKINWCELNEITLYQLPYNEVNRWKEILIKS